MAIIPAIKIQVDEKIRTKNLPGSILRGDHANIEDSLAEEIRVRGCLQLAAIEDLATASNDNTKLILIKTVGFFVALETADPADDVTTFASADAGWLWEKVFSSGGSDKVEFNFSDTYDYEIPEGFMLEKITFRSTEPETAKIGTTDGGTEILLPDADNPFPEDVRKSVMIDVIAEDGPVTIYFRGWSGDVNVILWLRKL